jgi:hypothetical protein
MHLKAYAFSKKQWPSARLGEILSDVSNFSCDPRCGISYGREQVTGDARKYDPSGLADFVESKGTFPVPITVADNCAGHLSHRGLPSGYIMMEGHRRHSMGLYLATKNKMAGDVPIWLMTRI